jgi:hypothetical protein
MFELAPTDIRSLLGRASIDFDDEDQKHDAARVWYRGRKRARTGTVRTLWPPATSRKLPEAPYGGLEPRRRLG